MNKGQEGSALGRESVLELRIYEVAPGQLEQLRRRFVAATLPLFRRHGIVAYGPWEYQVDGRDYVAYLVEFSDAEERDRRLAAFRSDPEWVAAREQSEGGGPLTARIDVYPLRPMPQ